MSPCAVAAPRIRPTTRATTIHSHDAAIGGAVAGAVDDPGAAVGVTPAIVAVSACQSAFVICVIRAASGSPNTQISPPGN